MRCFSKPGPPRLGTTVLLALAVSLALCGPPFALAGVPDETCAGCHEEVAAAFAGTAHGRLLSERPTYQGKMCESCHGDGTAHVDQSDPALIINPARQDQFGGAELCLTCHKGSEFDSWSFSHHSMAGVSCASCHMVHSNDPTASLYGAASCYGCHANVRASMSMPSHHPVAEGKMTCQSCHNPHGGSVALTHDDSNRELCFSCHADVEGPFVYEHAPVNEDCMICHQPHGTVADNLLKQTEPALCLNCHAMHFHATVEGVDGPFTTPMAPERASISTPDSWKEAMLTKCTRCHSAVHGTDLPSQAISTGGNALTR